MLSVVGAWLECFTLAAHGIPGRLARLSSLYRGRNWGQIKWLSQGQTTISQSQDQSPKPIHLMILPCWLFSESNIFPCVFSHCISSSQNWSKFICLCRKIALSISGVLTLHTWTEIHASPTPLAASAQPKQPPISPQVKDDTGSPLYIEKSLYGEGEG